MPLVRWPRLLVVCALVLLVPLSLATPTEAKRKSKDDAKAETVAEKLPVDERLLEAVSWRSIGPYRGGRSAAATGVVGQPNVYYFGGTGGGVWKTTDSGNNWTPISDGFFGGSIGAVEVNQLDPNVIYVGGGEKTVRGNVSHGSGLWKSTDAGATWTHMGLEDSRRIPRIRTHPRDPDLVYVAVLGHLFGPSEGRGVFRSRDGGATFEKVLYANEDAGAVDLIMDPNNPRVLYATTWRVRRTPWSLESGGEGSGLWKTTDGGDNWTELTRNPGLPKGTIGISGITVSPSDSNNVYAIVEAEKGGVFRSRDGGKTWTKTNDERSLRQRAWYYTRIYADPADADSVYVLNVQFHFSKDGGKTFTTIPVPHGDNHDLWIDPHDPLRMIEANDGGANVSFDRGATWTRQDNQPTAQFYRVTTDNHVPYRIYGAQQDNSTVRILSRTDGRGIGARDWEPTAGGESGHIAPKADDPEIVYGGSYDGFLTRVDHRAETLRVVDVWPNNPMGWGAAELKYRFQWNFPIFFSPHDSGTLYTAANVLFKTTNEGQTWEPISPDLTRNDKSTQGSSGGPITKDNTSVEYYGTIFSAIESPHEPGVFWAGSDDGLMHVSRDGGANWTNVTPDWPEWMLVNSIEAHPFEPGGLYVAGTRYKSDDFTPYLYRTTDYGVTWTRIDEGIDREHFTRVIRADSERRGLLYAGTENGVYVSFDDGARWQSLQRNLPIVPITDLALKDNDLIAATQGRSFWVLDDLTPLHQLRDDLIEEDVHFFASRAVPRIGGRGGFGPPPTNLGQNPPSGVVFRYWLKEAIGGPPATSDVGTASATTEESDEATSSDDAETDDAETEDANSEDADGDEKEKKPDATLEILDAQGEVIRTFTNLKDEESNDEPLTTKAGMNRYVWNLRHEGAERFPGMILWSGFGMSGPLALPGDYQARLTVGESVQTVPFVIEPDPRYDTSRADLEAQFAAQMAIRDKLSEAHGAIKDMRALRAQLDAIRARVKDQDAFDDLVAAADALDEKMTAVEEALYQTKNRSRQDPLNFPVRLTDKLSGVAGVMGFGQWRPTDGAAAVRDELFAAIDAELATWATLRDEDVPSFNETAREIVLPALMLEDDDE